MSRKQFALASCALSALVWAGGAAAQTAGNIGPPANPALSSSPPPANSPAPEERSQSRGGSKSDPYATAPTQQDTNASSATEVSQVVVTANKRPDTVQTAPFAVTAFTDERRNLLGINTGRDIVNFTPSMNLQDEFLTLRGVGRYQQPGTGVDPGVAIYVDGIYTSSPAYLNQPDFLTDRIEVLSGPQVDFGRGSLGGAVDVVSKRPTADWHADLRVGYTTLEDAYVNAAVSGPITSTLRFRLGYAFADTHKGDQVNLAGGPDPNTGDGRLINAQLEWDATPDLNFWMSFQSFSENARGAYGVTGAGPSSGTVLNSRTGLSSPYLAPPAYTAAQATAPFFGLVPNPYFGINPYSNPQLLDPFTVDVNDVGFTHLTDDDTLTLIGTWNLHGATLKYLGGLSAYTYGQGLDADLTSRSTEPAPPRPPGAGGVRRHVRNGLQSRRRARAGGGRRQLCGGCALEQELVQSRARPDLSKRPSTQVERGRDILLGTVQDVRLLYGSARTFTRDPILFQRDAGSG